MIACFLLFLFERMIFNVRKTNKKQGLKEYIIVEKRLCWFLNLRWVFRGTALLFCLILVFEKGWNAFFDGRCCVNVFRCG
jgi:hypothetical protein